MIQKIELIKKSADKNPVANPIEKPAENSKNNSKISLLLANQDNPAAPRLIKAAQPNNRHTTHKVSQRLISLSASQDRKNSASKVDFTATSEQSAFSYCSCTNGQSTCDIF